MKALSIAGVDSVGCGRLPRILAKGGYEVHLLGSPRLAVNRSRFVSARTHCGEGPLATATAARESLATHRNEFDLIVIVDEPTLWAALALGDREWLRGWFPVPPDSPAVELLLSKTAFLVSCRDAGIETPPFAVCEGHGEIERTAAEMGFPVFAKATQGWAGSGLIYARDAADLAAQLRGRHFEGAVVQKEINGPPGSLSVLYENGEAICWFAYLMARTWPNRFSSACTVELFPHPEALALVEAAGRVTGFNGLCGIDFVHDAARDRLVLLEFNPRPTPVYHLGPHAGVDFSLALKERKVQSPNRSRQRIELYPQALYDAFDNLRLAAFFGAAADAPWDDPGLNAAWFRRFVTHQIPSGVKGRFER